jgi:hypothetical protein
MSKFWGSVPPLPGRIASRQWSWSLAEQTRSGQTPGADGREWKCGKWFFKVGKTQSSSHAKPMGFVQRARALISAQVEKHP